MKEDVLSRAGRYREVHPEGSYAKDPSPLKVKEVVLLGGSRYVLCLNEKQARKDAADRQAIVDSLQEKLKTNPKSLVGNKGYRKYLTLDRETVAVNRGLSVRAFEDVDAAEAWLGQRVGGEQPK